VEHFQPEGVVVDPITNLTSVGGGEEIKEMLTRVIDFLKNKGITSVFTSLTNAGSAMEQSEVGISSLMDTWLLLRSVESANERNRLLYVLKSRGMAHSNQVREFNLTDRGIVISDAYLGPSGIVTGSARAAREIQEEAALIEQKNELDRKKRDLERRRKVMQAKIEELKAGFETEREELERLAGEGREKESARVAQRGGMARMRMGE